MAVKRSNRGRSLGIIAAIVVVGGTAGWFIWRHFAPSVSTDDAQVSGHVSPVATRVGGTVKSILVRDNQAVKAGDVLIEIDPRDYELAVKRAEADLASAEAAARVARSGVPIATVTTSSQINIAHTGSSNAEAALRAAEREVDASKAKLTSARARETEATSSATKAAQDLERLKPLIAKDEISRQQYDAAVAAEQAARASLDVTRAGIIEAQANLEVADAKRAQAAGAVEQAGAQARVAATGSDQVALTHARVAGADAQVELAHTMLEQARVNLERTTIRAPASGIVSRRSVEPGQVVPAGQPLMAIAGLDDVWVTANFKETQLKSMKPGQSADVEVDAYGQTFHGHVESIAAATGATFSLLPPDNASGNFVKVVQRVPVKIVLDSNGGASTVLRPGMSVNATVHLK